MLLNGCAGLRGRAGGATLAVMKWTLLLVLAVGCQWTNQATRNAQMQAAILSSKYPPTCDTTRPDDRHVVIICQDKANEYVRPDIRQMSLMAARDAANSALSVGLPFVQEMGSSQGEILEASAVAPVDCTSVRTGVVTNTSCGGGGTVSRMTGYRLRFQYQFLTAEEAAPRMAPEVPREMQPIDAKLLRSWALEGLGQQPIAAQASPQVR